MSSIKKFLESLRQYLSTGTRALRQELEAVRESHAAVSAELANVQEKLQRTHAADARLLEDLRQQVNHIEAERASAHNQVEVLEHSLAEAGERQKATEEHVDTLATKLDTERSRHAADRHATETSLARIQEEQQSLLTLQSELGNTFHQVATRLLEDKQPRYPALHLMLVAGVLVVTGALVGVFAIGGLQGSDQEPVAMEQDLRDLRVFMKQHIHNQDALLQELTLALNKQTFGEQALAGKQPLEQEANRPQPELADFTPDVRELQASLIALGYDLGMQRPNGELGIKTRQALQEFRQFYLPHSDAGDSTISEQLAILILKSADLARTDAQRFNIGSDVLAAIRLGSIRTGVDFSFLMELARAESNFNPAARAPKSSATGLYQFRCYPWLEAIRTYGADYGLQDYARQVDTSSDGKPALQGIVRDPLHQEVLTLRLNPRLSTLLAAENIKRNLKILSYQTRHEAGRTDLYLAHFFGPAGAVTFLKTLEEEPDTIAGELFPKTAARNPGVFLNRQAKPRTVAEVYRQFDRKFNTGLYDARNPG